MRYPVIALFCCLLYSAGAQNNFNWGRNKGGPYTAKRDSLVIRIAALEKTVDSMRWQLRRANWQAEQLWDRQWDPVFLRGMREEDSIRISKIVWWKVMSMIFPGRGIFLEEGQNITINWDYSCLPRRWRKKFEKANHLGKYYQPPTSKQ